MRKTNYLLFLCLITFACSQAPKADEKTADTQNKTPITTGSIEQMNPALTQVIDLNTQIEILGEGFDWSEGPLWIRQINALLFSDIPPNKIMIWKEGEGVSEYLSPSGFTGDEEREGEPGSNGLLLNSRGKLVLCQHGDRRIAIMNAELNDPKPNYVTMVDRYQQKRFNSPNDAFFDRAGNLYFTDPPYGLEGNMDDPAKELMFQGVYRFNAADGSLDLLVDSITRPNGISLSPDEQTLYVASSDPEKAIWLAYDLQGDGTVQNGRIFYDVTDRVGKEGEQGLPDGMVVDNNGIIYATGPGGVWIFQPDGTALGRILTGQATSNCTLGGPDGKTLFITADMYLMAVRVL